MTIPAATANLLAKAWRNKTFNHSLQINAMRAVSLGIGFLGSIWASRCLGPNNLGISGMIIGAIAPFVLVINLNQISHYIRLYRGYASDAERDNLVETIATYKITACLVLMLAAVPFLILWNFPATWYVGLIAAFPYFFLTVNAPDWLLQGQDNIPASTRALTVQALLTTCLYLLFFRPGISAGTDLVVQDIALAIAMAFAWHTALKSRTVRLFRWSKLRQIIPIIGEGRWLIATGCAVYIFTSLDQPLVGWLYSIKEVGIYRTSIVLVGGVGAFTGYLPMLLYPRMLEWNQVGPAHLWHQQKKVLTYFGMFTIALTMGAFLFGPLIYHYIYGPAFQRGSYPFAFLLGAKLIAVMNGILGWGLVAQKKERALFISMVYVATFSLLFNLIFIPFFGAIGASSVNMLSEVLMLTLNINFILRSLKKEATRANQDIVHS